jgi:hypothetical protein
MEQRLACQTQLTALQQHCECMPIPVYAHKGCFMSHAHSGCRAAPWHHPFRRACMSAMLRLAALMARSSSRCCWCCLIAPIVAVRFGS